MEKFSALSKQPSSMGVYVTDHSIALNTMSNMTTFVLLGIQTISFYLLQLSVTSSRLDRRTIGQRMAFATQVYCILMENRVLEQKTTGKVSLQVPFCLRLYKALSNLI